MNLSAPSQQARISQTYNDRSSQCAGKIETESSQHTSSARACTTDEPSISKKHIVQPTNHFLRSFSLFLSPNPLIFILSGAAATAALRSLPAARDLGKSHNAASKERPCSARSPSTCERMQRASARRARRRRTRRRRSGSGELARGRPWGIGAMTRPFSRPRVPIYPSASS